MSGRRPVRRVPVSRLRRRRRRSSHGRDAEQLLTVIAVLAGVGLVVALVKWLLAHWVVLVVLAALAAGAGVVWWRRAQQRRQWQEAQQRELRYQLVQLDTLHHAQFEHAVRDLMVRDGCPDAARTGGRGDQGADVIATDPAGLRWVIQCKHRRNGLNGSAVGTPDLQRLNGTARPVHGADVVVMLTNGRFTRDAAPFGAAQRIHLVDRQLLARWAAGPWPLWELLPQLPPPRRARP
ncbi:restriction endonuclease [Streptomyces sp. 3N207]|uniref:restriction endonuclease n=1 Tax=Streptomyces sp. 3N207 TaxID=3457417 RepID=UPI003FD3F712